ncbi:hypothetical protein D3C80_1425130 [compost metagenome]
MDRFCIAAGCAFRANGHSPQIRISSNNDGSASKGDISRPDVDLLGEGPTDGHNALSVRRSCFPAFGLRPSLNGPVPSRPALGFGQFAGCDDFSLFITVPDHITKLPIVRSGFCCPDNGIHDRRYSTRDCSSPRRLDLVAGHLVLLFAVTVVVFGPVLTATLASWNRRRPFVAIMLIFAASKCACSTPFLRFCLLAHFALWAALGAPRRSLVALCV